MNCTKDFSPSGGVAQLLHCKGEPQASGRRYYHAAGQCCASLLLFRKNFKTDEAQTKEWKKGSHSLFLQLTTIERERTRTSWVNCPKIGILHVQLLVHYAEFTQFTLFAIFICLNFIIILILGRNAKKKSLPFRPQKTKLFGDGKFETRKVGTGLTGTQVAAFKRIP